MSKITNCIQISSNPKLKMSPEGDFFKVWVAFLKPVHDLTKKEMDVLAVCLKKRYEISKKVPDADMVDSILLSNETRKSICEDCHIKPKHLNVVLSKFRKNKVIRNEKFYLNLIPTINDEGAGLMINFNFKDEPQPIKLGNQRSLKNS